MSILPLNSGVSQPSSSSSPSGNDPLTLSQALIITAGMAGLIGLFSGMIIRFSLANSAHARFLSPLQTFPTLSSWTPEQPQGRSHIRDLPSDTQPYAQGVSPKTSQSQRQETLPASSNFSFSREEAGSAGFLRREREKSTDNSREVISGTGANFVAPKTFDTFADRKPSGRRMRDPWEALKAGPRLGETTNPSEAEVDYFIDGFYPEIGDPIVDDGTYYEIE